MDPKREISVPEVAKRLSCSIPHAQSLIRTNRIPGRKTERGWMTTVAAVDAYLQVRSRVRGQFNSGNKESI